MSVLYVRQPNARIAKNGGRIQVVQDGVVTAETLLSKLERVILLGPVSLGGQAARELLSAKIPVVYASSHGKVYGALAAGGSDAGTLFAQVDCSRDAEYAAKTARGIIAAKLTGQQDVLTAFAKNHDNGVIRQVLRLMEKGRTLLAKKSSTDSLRGVEGRMAAVYFKGYGQCFLQAGTSFVKRTRRPPRDPVNALLSFGYMLLLGEATAALQGCGLQPGIGFLHTAYNNRPALALDFMEALRPAVIDRLVLRIFNKNMLTAADFSVNETGVLLQLPGQQKFLHSYEEAMNTPSLFSGDKTVSPRDWLRQQAAAWKACLRCGEIWQPGMSMAEEAESNDCPGLL